MRPSEPRPPARRAVENERYRRRTAVAGIVAISVRVPSVRVPNSRPSHSNGGGRRSFCSSAICLPLIRSCRSTPLSCAGPTNSAGGL